MSNHLIFDNWIIREKMQKNYMKIEIEDAVWVDDKIWFCANHFNGLLCMDINTKEIEVVGTFPNEKYSGECLYGGMKYVDGKIFFIPLCAKDIVVYDIKMGKFDSIALDERAMPEKPMYPRFHSVQKCKDYLFLLPSFSKCVVRLDLRSYEIIYISEWLNQVENYIHNNEDIYFWKNSMLMDNKIYAPFGNAHAVMELNCDNLETIVHAINAPKTGYSGIDYDGENFWLTPRREGDLVCWNPITEEVEVISLHPEGEKRNPYTYAGVICDEDRVEIYLRIEEKLENTDDKRKIIFAPGLYSMVKKENNTILFFDTKTACLTKIDLNTKERHAVEVYSDVSLVDVSKIYKEKAIIEESTEIKLDSVLEFVLGRNDGMNNV